MGFTNHAQRSTPSYYLVVDSPVKKDLKFKKKSFKSDKPEPLEKAQEPNEKKSFQSLEIVSNLCKTLLQKYSALHLSEFKEKLNPGKLASTAKMEPKQIIL